MRRLSVVALPVIAALSACVGPAEGLWDPETHIVEADGRTLSIRAQFDPLQFAWFTRAHEPNGYLSYGDRALVIAAVEQQVGPKLCDGQPLTFEPGQVWNADLRLDDNNSLGLSHYMEDIGEWRVVATCS